MTAGLATANDDGRDSPAGRYGVTLPWPVRMLYVPWRWLVFAPFTLVNTVIMTAATLCAARFSENAAYRCTQLWAHLECACNLTRLRLHGREQMQPGQSYVIMTNHQSSFDFSLIAAIPGQLRWVMKAELKKVPVFGWAVSAAGAVWLDRKDQARAIASFDAVKPKLLRGISLQIFPEGTRSRDGRLGPFKKGGFMLALELGLPILPVTISGSGSVWPPKTLRVLPGTIDYTIHPPIDVRAYGLERRAELMAEVARVLASALPAEPGAA